MKLTVYIFAIALVVITVMFAVRTESTSQEKKAKPNKAMVKRGAYLVNVGGCNDCHSPKVFTKMGPMPDEKRLLSGHPAGSKMPDLPPGIIAPTPDKWGAISTNDFTAWVGPWGTSFTSNITPDDETGIGTWSESMFIGAMKTGKHMGIGRDILPPCRV